VFHRRRMQAPINSIKHYVHRTNTVVATGVLLSVPVVTTVVAPATASSLEVKEGSIVKAVHFELWLAGNGTTGVSAQFTVIVEKLNGAGVPMTAGQAVNLGAYPNKKNILYTSQGQLGAQVDGNQSVPMVRGWILIPKGKQRMGLGDRIFFHVHSVGSVRVCGLTTYKEYV